MVECQVLASRLSGIETGKVILAQSQNFFFLIVTFWNMYEEIFWGKTSAWGKKYPMINQLLCTLDNIRAQQQQ